MSTVLQPSVCPRCDGEGFTIHPGNGYHMPCIDCRCIGCGKELTGGGLCPPCDADDLYARDTARERRAH